MRNLTLSFILLLNVAASSAQSSRIFFTESGSEHIGSIKSDGTDRKIHQNTEFPLDVIFNKSNQQVYWVDFNNGTIQTTDVDGNNRKVIVSNLNSPSSISIDSITNSIYILEHGGKRILRANLNGSGLSTLLNNIGEGIDLIFHAQSNSLYWSTTNPGKIWKSNVDGSNKVEILSGLEVPDDLNIDDATSRIFWNDRSSFSGGVYRASLNGQGKFTIVNESVNVMTLNAGKVYYAPKFASGLYSCTLNGTNKTQISALSYREATSMDINSNTLSHFITTHQFGAYLWRANEDGSSQRTLVQKRVNLPSSLSVNKTTGALVWANRNSNDSGDTTSRIMMQLPWNQDSVVQVYKGANNHNYVSVAVDWESNTLYYINRKFPTEMAKMDLNGQNWNKFNISDFEYPNFLWLNKKNNRLYWSDNGAGTLRSSLTDGTDVQIVLSGLSSPQGFVIDTLSNLLYYTSDGKVSKSNLDGSQSLLVTSQVSNPISVAVHPTLDELYISTSNKIYKSKKDGTDLQQLFLNTAFGSSISNILFLEDKFSNSIEVDFLKLAVRQSNNQVELVFPESSDYQVSVLSLNGREVVKTSHKNINALLISTESFSPGLYLARVENREGKIGFQKFVVSH